MEVNTGRRKPASGRSTNVNICDVNSGWKKEVFVAKRDADFTEFIVPTVARQRSVARGRNRVARVGFKSGTKLYRSFVKELI